MSSLAQKAKLKRKRSNADDGSSSTLPLPSHRAGRTYQAANAAANPVGAADFDADTIPARRGMPAAQRPTSTLKKTLASGTPVANRGTTVATAVHGSKPGSSAALAISLSDDDDYSGANDSGRAQANGLPNESLPQQRPKALEVTMDTTVPNDNAYLSRGSLRRGQADLSKPGLSGFAQTHAGSALTSYTPTPSYSAIVHSFSTFVHSNRSARSPAFGSSVQNSNRRRSPSSDMGNDMQDMDIDPESPVASPAAHRNLNAGGKPAVAILPPSSPPVTSRQYTAAHSPAAASLAPPMPPDARSPSLEDGEISMEDGEIADEREPSPPRSFVPQPAAVPAPAPRKKARTRAPAFQYQQSAPTSSPYAARPQSPPSRYPYSPAAPYPPPPPPRYDYPPPPPPPPQWGQASSDQPPPALGPPSAYSFDHPPYPPATPAYPFASGYPPPPPGSVPFQPPPPPDAPPPAPPPPPSLPNPEFMPFMPVDDFDYAGMLAPPSHPPRPGKLSKKEKKLAKAAKAASEGLSKKQKKNAKKLQNQNVLLAAAPDPTLHAYAHGWPIANQGPGPQAIALDVQSQRDACKYETFDVHEAKHVLSDLLAWEYQLDHIADLGLVPEVAVRALRELRPDMVLPDFLKGVDDGEAALLAVQKVLRARNTNIAGNDGYAPPPAHPLVQSSPADLSTTSVPEVAQFGMVHQAFLAQTAPIAESAPAASLPQASVAQPQAGSSRVPDKSRELEQSMEELRARIAVLESMKAKKKQKAAAAAVAAPPAGSEDVAMAEATSAAAMPEAEPATTVVLPRATLAPLATDVRSQEPHASPRSASGSSVAPATAMDVDPDEITSFLKNIPLPAPTIASQGVSRSRSHTPLSASDLPGPRPAKRFRPVAADFEEAPPAPPVLKRATTSFARLDLVVHSCVIDISDDEEDLHSSAQAGPSRTAAAQSKPVVALTSQELEIAQLKARIAAAERKRQLAKQSKASGSGAATPA